MSIATIPTQRPVRVELFDRARAIRDYEIKMLAAIRRFETEKAEYEAVQEAYKTPGTPPEVAKVRAGGDPRTDDAYRRGVWFRDEALMYAAAVTALRGGPR